MQLHVFLLGIVYFPKWESCAHSKAQAATTHLCG